MRYTLLVCTIFGYFLLYSQLPELQTSYLENLKYIRDIEAEISGKDNVEPGYILGLARSYSAVNDFKKAENAYLKIIDNKICSPLDYKSLSIALLHNHKYSLAKEFMAMYTSATGDNDFKTNFNHVIELSEESKFEFSESRTELNKTYGVKHEEALYLNENNQILTAEMLNGRFKNKQFIKLPEVGTPVMGTHCLGPKSSTYIYSALQENGQFKIYQVEQKNGKFKKPKPLSLGPNDADYIHPYYHDGILYFSSNRRDGAGGFDIFKAQWINGQWDNIASLGGNINTHRDEILPQRISNSFAFSSNGHPGFGGFDIYKVENNQVIQGGKLWNSADNDYSMISHDVTHASVISEGENQYYLRHTSKKEIKENVLTLQVVDSEYKGIKNAKVLINKGQQTQGYYRNSDVNGYAEFLVDKNIKEWILSVSAPGYVTNDFNASTEQILKKKPMVISLVKEEEIIDPVYIVSSNSSSVPVTEPDTETYPIAQSYPINSDSQSIKPETEVFDEMSFSNGQYYIVIGSARSYPSAYAFLQRWDEKFPNAEILQNTEKGIYRVGIFAGKTESEAMQAYRKARKIKESVWLLRPNR